MRLMTRFIAGLRPITAVERAILDGFSEVRDGEAFHALEIGDGAGDFESVEKGVIKRKSTEWVRFGRQLPSILLPQKNPKSATYKLFSSIFLLIFTPARPQSRMNACGSHLP